MSLLRSAVVVAGLATLFVPSLARAEDTSCFPACRRGYLCHAGACVSECNPPCGDGETCEARECRLRTSATTTTSSEAPVPDRVRSAPVRDLPSFAMTAGPAMFFATNTAPAIALSVRYQMPTQHAFVAGGRFLLGLPEGTDFFVLGTDLGYAGTFFRGDVDAGLLAVGQPQVWVGGRDALLYMGAAVGPFVRNGHFQAELLLGGGFATLLSDPYQGRSRDLGAVGTGALLAGAAF